MQTPFFGLFFFLNICLNIFSVALLNLLRVLEGMQS